MVSENKFCPKCGKDKPITDYYFRTLLSGKKIPYSYCKYHRKDASNIINLENNDDGLDQIKCEMCENLKSINNFKDQFLLMLNSDVLNFKDTKKRIADSGWKMVCNLCGLKRRKEYVGHEIKVNESLIRKIKTPKEMEQLNE